MEGESSIFGFEKRKSKVVFSKKKEMFFEERVQKGLSKKKRGLFPESFEEERRGSSKKKASFFEEGSFEEGVIIFEETGWFFRDMPCMKRVYRDK